MRVSAWLFLATLASFSTALTCIPGWNISFEEMWNLQSNGHFATCNGSVSSKDTLEIRELSDIVPIYQMRMTTLVGGNPVSRRFFSRTEFALRLLLDAGADGEKVRGEYAAAPEPFSLEEVLRDHADPLKAQLRPLPEAMQVLVKQGDSQEFSIVLSLPGNNQSVRFDCKKAL